MGPVIFVYYRSIGCIRKSLTTLTLFTLEFIATGVSPVSMADKLITGRPYGGVATLYRKSIAQHVTVKPMYDPRIVAVHVLSVVYELSICNVYLPYETPDNFDDYMHYLAKIKECIKGSITHSGYVIGDFNANISKNTKFGSELTHFCQFHSLSICDAEVFQTYVSEAHGTISWLDHCIATASARRAVIDIQVLYSYAAGDHIPLSVTIQCDLIPPNVDQYTNDNETNEHVGFKWTNITERMASSYSEASANNLAGVAVPYSAITCKNVRCSDEIHVKA